MIRFYLLLIFCWFFSYAAVQAQPFTTATQAFQQGHYEQAIREWQAALASPQSPQHRLEATLGMARAYRHLGAYNKTLNLLNSALSLAPEMDDTIYHVQVLNELSKLHLSQGEKGRREAIEPAKKAVSLARKANNPQILFEVLNHWGNLLTAEYDYEGALEAYREALTLLDSGDKISRYSSLSQARRESSSTAENEILHGKILINQAQTLLLLDAENAPSQQNKKAAFKASIAALERAKQATQNWPEGKNQAFGLIKIGVLAQKIQARLSQPDAQLSRIAYQTLMAALEMAKRLDNAAAKAYAYGYLGHLYEQAERYSEALSLTRQAVFFAGQTRQQQILYLWQWQLGRINKAQGDRNGAIAAYQQAVDNLKPVRVQVASTGYLTITESFRELIAPIYFELADLLLQKARATHGSKQRQQLLRQARQAIEFFKEAELQDYFQSDCIDLETQCTDFDQLIDSQTAVLYPIPLPDRLELLLQRHDGLIQVTIPVSEVTLRDEIASFLSPLRRHPYMVEFDRGGRDDESPEEDAFICDPALQRGPIPKMDKQAQAFLEPAQTLYNWLIQPLSSGLHDIKTLIIVPDGALRTMPFSALHDGQQFLIQKYALAITPGLCLRSQPAQPLHEPAGILLGGLSEAVQDFSSLPCAEHELKSLFQLFDSVDAPLLNHDFTTPNVHLELKQKAYSVVHIASHGQFSGNLKDTFILTYDDKLSMDSLEQLMSLATLQKRPVELLTLSACETAVGDDRAALGLAGVALKAGVASALASLWKVDDVATQAIVVEFYRQLHNHNLSKALALQNAQKIMLTDRKYRAYQHPYFWSAFLLIGNWL